MTRLNDFIKSRWLIYGKKCQKSYSFHNSFFFFNIRTKHNDAKTTLKDKDKNIEQNQVLLKIAKKTTTVKKLAISI